MPEQNVMQVKIQEWKAAHKEKPRDLDFDMLCSVLDSVNEASAVKIACNPLDENRNWSSDAPSYNVGKVTVDDQGRLTLYIRRSNEEFSVEKLQNQIRHLRKKVIGKTSCVMAQISDTKCVQLTDVYSHALMRDSWAGLPFDIVLAYYEKG